jgi:peptide chain release factor subunit 1
MASDDAPLAPGLEPQAPRLARRLLERTGKHPVISVYFDLEPDEFATAAARETEVHSLIDCARRERTGDATLTHQDRTVLTEDLERVESYLLSDEAPVSGARALAVFCSGQDDLFEAARLGSSVVPRVVIASTPLVEPLVAGHDPGPWCVALVNSREARIFEGRVERLAEREKVTDDVRGRHRQGGPSQANYERSVENEVDQHLRRVGTELYRRWQSDGYSTLVLGGPREVVSRLEQLLHNDLRAVLLSARVELDVAAANEAEVRKAAYALLTAVQTEAQRTTLERLWARVARGDPAVVGLDAVLEALAEHRVQTLVISWGFAAAGGGCPRCGLLSSSGEGTCPADGMPLVAVADLREAAVEQAVLQDAEVLVLQDPPPGREPSGGIGALLRF